MLQNESLQNTNLIHTALAVESNGVKILNIIIKKKKTWENYLKMKKKKKTSYLIAVPFFI